MHRSEQENVNALITGIAAVAAIPLAVWLTRPRPPSTVSIAELELQVRNLRQEEVMHCMAKRYEGMRLNFDGPDTGTDPEVRWQELLVSLGDEGATVNEAQAVIRSARVKLQKEWPCWVERGYFKGEPVWLVTGSTPRDTGFMGWLCTPTADAIHNEKVKKYCSNMRVAVVRAQRPYSLMN